MERWKIYSSTSTSSLLCNTVIAGQYSSFTQAAPLSCSHPARTRREVAIVATRITFAKWAETGGERIATITWDLFLVQKDIFLW